MTETKFTPGPWVVGGKLIIGPIINSDDQCNGFIKEVCDASFSAGDKLANAHLIAAAPDLYEALQACLNFMENTESELGFSLESADQARTALAKARGEL